MYLPVAYAISPFLQVDACVGELVEVAEVVVVHVREDHVARAAGLHAQQYQTVNGTAQESALSLLRHLAGEARIDQVDGAGTRGHPHEVVHRHGPVVRIATDEMVAALRLAGGVAEGKHLEFGQRCRHRKTSCGLGACTNGTWPAHASMGARSPAMPSRSRRTRRSAPRA